MQIVDLQGINQASNIVIGPLVICAIFHLIMLPPLHVQKRMKNLIFNQSWTALQPMLFTVLRAIKIVGLAAILNPSILVKHLE